MGRTAAWLCALGALCGLGAGAAPARAESELTARAIMEKVDARDDGDHSSQDL